MSRFTYAPMARRDLDEIWMRIAQDNIDAAERVVDEIEAAVRTLAQMPGMGHRREELPDRRDYHLTILPSAAFALHLRHNRSYACVM